MANPLLDVYNALWTLAERHPTIAALKAGNKIKFSTAAVRDPEKETIAAADVPELSLIVQSGTHLDRVTSSSSSLTRTYRFGVVVGDRRYALISELEWALFCALSDWDVVMSQLTYNSKRYVTLTRSEGMLTGLTDPELSRGLNGWVSLWSLTVQMHFATADLKSELT